MSIKKDSPRSQLKVVNQQSKIILVAEIRKRLSETDLTCKECGMSPKIKEVRSGVRLLNVCKHVRPAMMEIYDQARAAMIQKRPPLN